MFCLFLNDMEPINTKAVRKWCAMPKNAKQLEEAVYAISKEHPIPPPKKPKATLLSFFGEK